MEMEVCVGVALGNIPATGIKTSITVVGDSFPKGTEGTVC